MSTLNVSNISDGTDTVETGYVVNGSAKAWVSYYQISPTIEASFNVSSVTDVSAGSSTINFSSSLNGVSYPAPANQSFSSTEPGVFSRNTASASTDVLTRSSTAAVDRRYNLAQMGDLA